MDVHDNVIHSYLIDLSNGVIRLHTKRDPTYGDVKNDIVFTEVLAHYFENELSTVSNNVIFDIEEKDVEIIFRWNLELFAKRKSMGWPCRYDTIEELSEKVKRDGYHSYLIISSNGLGGWVLAKSCVIEEV